jgi:hypothetical protein
VVLLSVIRRPDAAPGEDEAPPALHNALDVARAALVTSLASGHAPETLLTVADEPWAEIARIARSEECESLLLGFATLDDPQGVGRIEKLLNEVDCDVAVLRAPTRWSLRRAHRIVVPIGGRGGHDDLRARVLGSLGRQGQREVLFVQVVPAATPEARRVQIERQLRGFAEEETHGTPRAEVLASDEVVAALTKLSRPDDLFILGLQQHRGQRLFGELSVRIARASDAAILMISRRR